MIAGEATHNAAKHGKPTQIELSLLHDDTELVLKIADNGRGLDAQIAHSERSATTGPPSLFQGPPRPVAGENPHGRRGLHIMRYRARQSALQSGFSRRPAAEPPFTASLPLGVAPPPPSDTSPPSSPY